jgi:hypothetical protein
MALSEINFVDAKRTEVSRMGQNCLLLSGGCGELSDSIKIQTILFSSETIDCSGEAL